MTKVGRREFVGDALKCDTEEWYEMFREADKMEGLIKSNWAGLQLSI